MGSIANIQSVEILRMVYPIQNVDDESVVENVV